MKKQSIDFSQFRINGDVKVEAQENGHLLTFPPEGGRLILAGMPMHLGGVDWTDATHLVFDMTTLEDFEISMITVFMSGGDPTRDPSAIFNTGVLPGIRVQSARALSDLDSNRMFTPRTPGRVKQIVLGQGVDLKNVSVIIITTKKCYKPQQILLHDVYLTWGEPEYKPEEKKLVDKFGQLTTRNWAGKTTSEEELVTNLHKAVAQHSGKDSFEGRSRFGGDLSTRWEATGFFRTHFDGNRWYLVDPDGYRFISTGVDCMKVNDDNNYNGIEMLYEEMPDPEVFPDAYSQGDPGAEWNAKTVHFSVANLMRAFGSAWKEKWMKMSKGRMIDWYINTIGNWSDPEFIKEAKLPYVWPLDDFPTTEMRIFRDFPDVYSEEYTRNSEEFAKQMEQFKGDPYMVGYFLRNEPEWGFVQHLLIAEKLLENSAPFKSKDVFIQELTEKYGTIEALNAAWNKDFASFDDLRCGIGRMSTFSDAARQDAHDFSVKMIRRYVTVPSQACKKVDPDHMNLGMRYAMLIDPILLEGYENFDVFSLNCYSDEPYKMVQQAGEITGKPIIIGEFQYGALDGGMLCAGIRSVMTQKDRGLAYRDYYENAMNSPYFVGAHYFTLNNESTLGRFDGENMQIGLVDVCQTPYTEFVEMFTQTNRDIYKIADGERLNLGDQIQRIPQIMGF